MAIDVATLRAILTLDASQFTSGANKARESLHTITDGFSKTGLGAASLASTIGNLAANGITRLTSFGASAIRMGFQTAAATETANVAFTQFFKGNTEAASAFQKKLQQFAAETPFEFPQLRQAASSMLAVGVAADRVIPIMRTVGDAIASVGGGQEAIQRATIALQQMAQKGKVTAEEMLQLTEAGIPAWDALAGELGTDVAGAMKKVEQRTVDADAMFRALEKHTGTALGNMTGMMEKQALTLTGLWSTFKDTVSMRLAETFTSMVNAAKEALPTVTTEIDKALNRIGPSVTRLGSALIKAVTAALPLLTPVVDAFARLAALVAERVTPFFEKLSPIVGEVLDILSDTAVKAAGPLFDALDKIVTSVGPELPDVVRSLADLAGAVAQLASAAAPLYVDLLKLKLDVLAGLANILTPIVKALVPMADAMSQNDIFVHSLAAGWALWKTAEILEFLGKAGPAAVESAKGFAQLASSAWASAGGLWAAYWPLALIVIALAAVIAATYYAYTHWKWFHDALDAYRVTAQIVWQQVLVPFADWLQRSFTQAVSTARVEWDKWTNAIRIGVDDVKKAMVELPPTFSLAFSQIAAAPQTALASLSTLWQTVVGFAQTGALMLPSLFNTWADAFFLWVFRAAVELPGRLGLITGQVLLWIVNTATGIAVGIASWATAVGGGVLRIAASLPGWLAVLGSIVFNWVITTAGGIAVGLTTWTAQFARWAYSTAALLWGALQAIGNTVWGWLLSMPGRIGAGLTLWSVPFRNWAFSTAVQLPGWCSSIATSLVTFIFSIPGRVMGAISTLWVIGQEIARSIWRGLTSAGGWLYNAVTGWARGLIDGVKNGLGIHSPSRQLMEVGQVMAQSIGLGWQRQAPGLQRSIDGVMAGLDYRMPGAAALSAVVRRPGAGTGALGATPAATYQAAGGLNVYVGGRARPEDGEAVIAAAAAYERNNGATWRGAGSALVAGSW